MVAAFDFCLHGKGGAAPSIDTAMHGLVDAAARRPPAPGLGHRAGDRGRRREADARVLRRPRGVGAVAAAGLPARAWTSPRSRRPTRRRSAASSAATASPRGATPARSARRNSLEIIRTAEAFIAERGRPEPFGALLAGYAPLPEAERHARAAALAPVIRGLASTDRPQVGHFTDADVVLDFLAGAEHPRLAALGTSCPDHFLRTKVRPMVLDLPPTRRWRRSIARLRELHAAYREDYARLLREVRDGRTRRRCAAPTRRSCWCRASACSASARTSRPRGWPASSTSTPST